MSEAQRAGGIERGNPRREEGEDRGQDIKDINGDRERGSDAGEDIQLDEAGEDE